MGKKSKNKTNNINKANNTNKSKLETIQNDVGNVDAETFLSQVDECMLFFLVTMITYTQII